MRTVALSSTCTVVHVVAKAQAGSRQYCRILLHSRTRTAYSCIVGVVSYYRYLRYCRILAAGLQYEAATGRSGGTY